MQTVNKFISYEQKENYHQINTNEAIIRIYVMGLDVFRIRVSFNEEFKEHSYLLVKTAWEDQMDGFFGDERTRIETYHAEVQEIEDKIIISTEISRLKINKNPFAIQLFDQEDQLIYSDLLDRAYQRDRLGRVYHYNQINSTDCFYGFGEKTGKLNKNGRYFRFSPKDSIGYNPISGDPMYKHIPMYIRLDGKNNHAIGLFYHNTFESAMSIGDEISGYWPRYTYFVADDGDIDYFLINGPSISEAIMKYTDLTGTTVMQPKYSLGYLGSTMYYVELPEKCDDEIVGFVDRAKKEGILIDSFMLSSGYTKSNDGKRHVFTWNQKKFPDIKSFFTRMNDRGVVVSPNVKPGILKTHPEYSNMKDQNCFIFNKEGDKVQEVRWWGGKGAYFDFTNPKARDVWSDFLVNQLIEYGTNSIWNDNCEYDGIDERMARVDCEGQNGSFGEFKSIQPTLMAYTSHIAQKKSNPEIRPYVICRSGGIGIQRYAQTWAGDNPTSFETLKYNISTLLGLGLSGVANVGADNGGFHGPAPSAELLVRWVQNGIFQPRFSIHSSNNDNTVTEPWMYSTHTKYIKNAIELRYKLIPYLYSLLWEAHINGLPIMRPLIMEFQSDAMCREESFHFMEGPSLLVANVISEGQNTKRIYLPQGTKWYDFYTRECYEGGQEIKTSVNIDSIPMFIREGAIIPLSDEKKSVHEEKQSQVRFLIEAGIEGEFDYYEDDGITNKFKEGEFLITHINTHPGETVRINFSYDGNYKSPTKTILLDLIRRDKGPFWVSVDSRKLPQYLNKGKWTDAAEGWFYDHDIKSVLVKYERPTTNYDIDICFEDFDLIGM